MSETVTVYVNGARTTVPQIVPSNTMIRKHLGVPKGWLICLEADEDQEGIAFSQGEMIFEGQRFVTRKRERVTPKPTEERPPWESDPEAWKDG